MDEVSFLERDELISNVERRATEPGEERAPASADVSREIVRLHARYYGRGPTRSKTVWRDEVLVCLLGDIFTRGEQVLVDAGHFEQVRSSRQSFQDTMEPLMRGVVEGITGRRVRSFLSQISPEGLASEVFVLEGEAAAIGGNSPAA